MRSQIEVISEEYEHEDANHNIDTTLTMFRSHPSSQLFRDQICTLTSWFSQWTECEQTVALYTLLRQLDQRQARFIEHLLQEQSSLDASIDAAENEANQLDFVMSLESSAKQEEIVTLLLSHFPLLHPGNDSVKDEYLKVLPKVLAYCVENRVCVEDCRKLLTYTLIHPAISNQERTQFTKWLGQLEKQYSLKITQTQLSHSNVHNLSTYAEQMDSAIGHAISANSNNVSQDSGISGDTPGDQEFGMHLPLHATASAPPHGGGSGSHQQINSNNHKRLSRTASCLPQPSANIHSTSTWQNAPLLHQVSDWLLRSEGAISPCSEHGQLSPQSSLSSADSDQDLTARSIFREENSGMKDFPSWLKGLRLHKYSQLFTMVPYDEMLTIDESWLELRNVTKGARNKLAQSISKLRERPADLRRMENLVMQGANLRQVLIDLKAIVATPIKKYTPPEGAAASSEIVDEDLPALVNRIMGRLCTQLLVNSQVEDECFPLYIQLLDKCVHHEAFTPKQRKLLQEWKSQVVQRISGRLITGRQETRIMPSHKPTSRTNSWNRRTGKGNGFFAQRAVQNQPSLHEGRGHMPWSMSYDKKPLAMTFSGPEHLNVPLQPQNKQAVKLSVHRTQSAPLRAQQPQFIRKAMATEPEINERLDSLCRSMTEAALDPQDGSDHTEHGSMAAM